MENLQLRLLDPTTDRDLFVTAYNWRVPKKHLFGPRIDLETFTDTEAAHLTFGLFNQDELIAVYFLREMVPSRFESHFTSKKGTPREVLLQGAKTVMDLCMENGASEVYGLVLLENHPLRQFVTEVGMVKVSHLLFTCLNDLNSVTFSMRNHRTFVKYAKRA